MRQNKYNTLETSDNAFFFIMEQFKWWLQWEDNFSFWDPYTMPILSSKDSYNDAHFNQQCRFRESIGCNSKLGIVKIFSKLNLVAGFAHRSWCKLQ